MSDPSVGELFQDSLSFVSDVIEGLSPLRTQQLFSFLGTILTTLLTIFINTITKLLMITAAKILLLAILKHFHISGVLKDFALSRGSPLVNIEDASIHYLSPEDEYPYLAAGEEYNGRYKYPTGTEYRDGYNEERKKEQGLWDELLDWIVFDIL